MKGNLVENEKVKIFRSEKYNYNFNKITGEFIRWGATLEEDPDFSPVGPELLDIELSINGCPNNCPFCYKSNTNTSPTNMSLENFKKILDKLPPTLTQIAFGITGVQTNPELIEIFKETRKRGIIPNFTLSGIDITPALAEELSKIIGAVAVSCYQKDKNTCYNTVKMFTDLGISQTNIHFMLSKETLEFCHEVLEDWKTDPRLEKLNAIVFLGVKQKGRATHYNPVRSEEFLHIVKRALDSDKNFGFDSCTSSKFENILAEQSEFLNFTPTQVQNILMLCERCESSLFSLYIDVDGKAWPCSFCEKEPGVENIDMLNCTDFIRDVWYNPSLVKFRKKLLENNRECPQFKI